MPIVVNKNEISNRYQIRRNIESSLKNENYAQDLSKQLAELSDVQKKFFDAIVELLKNLFITQRSNIELADVEFSRVLLNNLSGQQLTWLKNALDIKSDEIIALIKDRLNVELDLSNKTIDLSFQKKLDDKIEYYCESLRKKIDEIPTSSKTKKSNKSALVPSITLDPSEYDARINLNVESIVFGIRSAMFRMSTRMLNIETNFTSANNLLNELSNISFLTTTMHRFVPVSPIRISGYFLTYDNIETLFHEVNSRYFEAVNSFNNGNALNQIDVPITISPREEARERLRLSRQRNALLNDIKSIFTVTFVGDLLLFPIRLFKKANKTVKSITSWVKKWFGIIFMPLINLTKFGWFLFKESLSVLLIPVKRLTSYTLKFATFLMKKAVRIASYSLKRVTSMLVSLLAPKSIFKAVVNFFKTPIGAYILGYVIGKIYIFGKAIFGHVKEKIIKAYKIIDKAKDDFVEWFSDTAIGKWFSDTAKWISSFESVADFLEHCGNTVIDIADKIVSVNFSWVFEDIKNWLIDNAAGMISGGIGALLGSLGAFIPIPGAGLVLSILGGIAGDKIGREIAYRMTGYFKVKKNRDEYFDKAISFANVGTYDAMERITVGVGHDADMIRDVADTLLDKYKNLSESEKTNAEHQLAYMQSVENARKAAFSEGGKFSDYESEYRQMNKDYHVDREGNVTTAIGYEEKISNIEENIEKEIREVSNQLDESVMHDDIAKILGETKLQYNFYDKNAKPYNLDIHPYRFRFLRAIFLRSLINNYKLNQMPIQEFIADYNGLATSGVGTRYEKISLPTAWFRKKLVTGKSFLDMEPASDEKDKWKPKLSLTQDEMTEISSYRYKDEIINDILSQQGYSNVQRYGKLFAKETFDSLMAYATGKDFVDQMKAAGLDDAIIEVAKDRLKQYMFVLMSSANFHTNEDDVKELFAKTWIHPLAGMLSTTEFGNVNSKTKLQKLIESISEKEVRKLDDNLRQGIASGTITTSDSLWKLSNESVIKEEPTEHASLEMMDGAIKSMGAFLKASKERVDSVLGRDPAHEGDFDKKVQSIKEMLASWYDRHVQPILVSENYSTVPSNPAALDSK